MTVKEAAKFLNWSELLVREAIAQGEVDFGICVRIPGSSRRTFKINERKVREWVSSNTEEAKQNYTNAGKK